MLGLALADVGSCTPVRHLPFGVQWGAPGREGLPFLLMGYSLYNYLCSSSWSSKLKITSIHFSEQEVSQSGPQIALWNESDTSTVQVATGTLVGG